MLENKLGITTQTELSLEEERISKIKAYKILNENIFKHSQIGTYFNLSQIHEYLFEDIYYFAGKVRSVNIAKGNFRFASVMYLEESLKNIDKMPQSNFNEIIEKYVEMNIAHPFLEGNGRSTRIWLDLILRKELSLIIDWDKVDKNDYLLAMERSPIKDIEIKFILENALIEDLSNNIIYMKGIDMSYYYEGYNNYRYP